MEARWPASLGRFQLNLRHYLRSPAVKTVASRHKCDDTLPLQKNCFQLLLGFSFLIKNYYYYYFSILRCNSKWSSSTRWFSQISFHIKYEIRKKPECFYILGYLLELVIKSSDLKKKIFKNLANLCHFPHEISFI
jgi:hypothetical protein